MREAMSIKKRWLAIQKIDVVNYLSIQSG